MNSQDVSTGYRMFCIMSQCLADDYENKELSCCWDGRSVLHNSNSAKLWESRCLGTIRREASVCGHESHNGKKTTIFGPHFCRIYHVIFC